MLASLAAGTAGAAPIETVALTGQPAAGGPPGAVWTSLHSPVIKYGGSVAFSGNASGGGLSFPDTYGFWRAGPSGSPQLVAGLGQQAVGTEAGSVHFLTAYPQLNNSQGVSFLSGLMGPSIDASNDFGIWTADAGLNVELLARKGSQAPGAPAGAVFAGFEEALLNVQGGSAFRGALTGTGVTAANDQALWGPDLFEDLTLVAREGDAAVGAAPGALFAEFQTPALADSGMVTFRATLSGVAGPGDRGIWTYQSLGAGEASGVLTNVAIGGNPAPGTAPGVTWIDLGDPVVNTSGGVAFQALLAGPGVTAANELAIFGPDASGDLGLVARTGDRAAGVGPGIDWAWLGSPTLNDRGDTAWLGGLTGTGVDASNELGIWLAGDAGNILLRAREGDALPVLPPGVVLADLRDPQLNELGQLLFVSSLAGAGVDASNDRAAFATTRAGDIVLVVREGDDIEVAPGDFRTVESFFIWNSVSPREAYRNLSDRGGITFSATFTDASEGIFTTLVPEPGSAALLLAGLAGLAVRRRAQSRPSFRRNERRTASAS